MNLLIFFSLVFATIILSIILERIIHCPILVGFAFFAIFLVVAAVSNSVALVIAAIALGILAFVVAFLDCIFRRSGFFRNNRCLTCNSNCNCGNDLNDTLRIFDSNGNMVARINGNNITCVDNNDNNCGVNIVSDNGNIATTSNTNFSNCGCGRNSRFRR